MKKICQSCRIEKDTSEFNRNIKRNDGYQASCRSCQNSYCKNHYNINKDRYKSKAERFRDKVRDWMNDLKSKLNCTVCPENHPACLDFHHVDPKTKSNTISDMVAFGYGIDAIKKEIDKCIVLCSNCHRKEHWNIKIAPSQGG